MRAWRERRKREADIAFVYWYDRHPGEWWKFRAMKPIPFLNGKTLDSGARR